MMVWWLTEGTGKIKRYYNGVWRSGTTRCCSALALATGIALVVSGQSIAPPPFPAPRPDARGNPQTSDRTPLSLFPVRTIWTLALNNQLTAAPVYEAHHGYFPIEDRRLVAYDLRSGTQQWIAAGSPLMTPAVGEGLLFLVEPGNLTALHTEDGSTAWQLPFAEQLAVPPVWDNGWLVAATATSEILAFRALDGQLIWRRALGSKAHARPALAADRVYVPTEDGRVVALRVDTGAPIWERTIGGAANDILAGDERLYVGSKNNYFYCLLATDGRIDWKWRTGGDVIGMPVRDEHRVYFVALDNVLRALNPTSGTQLWMAPLPLRPTGGPIAAADTVIVTGVASTMRAYNAKSGAAAGELPAGINIAAPPYVIAGKTGLPVILAVTRDITKGAAVLAISRAIEPPAAPIVPLPNVIPMGRPALPPKP
jgi:outer membrane protein assembly factor BamB